MSERCENCGKEIGKIETPRVWKESVVCGKCWSALDEDENPKPVVRQPVAVVASRPEPPPVQPQVVVASAAPQVVYVPQPMMQPQQINVSANSYSYAPKGNGVISTLAAVAAIVALLGSWIPVLGMVTIPMAMIALLLGVLGFLLNLLTRAPLGMPVAAILFSLLAVFVQLSVTGVTVGAIADAAEKASTQPTTRR